MAPSLWQLLIVLLIVALLFGTKRLRNIGGDIGGAIKGFKKAITDDDTKNLEQEKKDTAEDPLAVDANKQDHKVEK